MQISNESYACVVCAALRVCVCVIEKKGHYNNLSQVPNHDHIAIQMYDFKLVSVNLQLLRLGYK